LKQHIYKLDGGLWEVIHITESHTQVVAGVKYFFTGKFKNKKDNGVYNGKVWLWHRAWDNYSELGFEDKTKVE
jgi:hypothetical protein